MRCTKPQEGEELMKEKAVFGFVTRYGDKFYGEGHTAQEALESLTIGKKYDLMLLASLPIDLNKLPYVNVKGEKKMVTPEEWDAMWRSDRGHGRHER